MSGGEGAMEAAPPPCPAPTTLTMAKTTAILAIAAEAMVVEMRAVLGVGTRGSSVWLSLPPCIGCRGSRGPGLCRAPRPGPALLFRKLVLNGRLLLH